MNIAILEDDTIQQYQLLEVLNQASKQLKLSQINITTFRLVTEIQKQFFFPSSHNIYLLDLEISGDPQAGLKVAQLIREQDAYATIIFFTSHEDLLPLTYRYKVSALDFIAKDSPTLKEDLLNDLKYVMTHAKNTAQDMYTLACGKRFLNIAFANIGFFESDPSNSHASILWALDNRSLQISKNLHEIEQTDPRFFRVHQSFLVNVDNIESINKSEKLIYLKNGLTCPLSRRKIKALQDRLTHN